MEWEDKISSIVKETEANLARVRDQLGSSRIRHSSQAKYYSSPNLVPSSSFEKELRSSNPRLSYSTNGFQSTSPQRMSGIKVNQNEGSSSPALLNVLFERIEQQAETLSSLSHVVKRLEKEKHHQAEIISTLQDQVSRVNEKLREHGVDLETERKLEGFKREMYSHLERIQSQNRLKQNRDDISYGDPSNATLARDLHENKRLLQDDCNSLRREIDHLKTRISKIELDTQGTMADAKDSNRRLEYIDRTVAILSENQRSQSHSIGSIVDDKELRNSDMGSIREGLDEVLTKVSHLESNLEGKSHDRYHRKQSGISSTGKKSTYAQNIGRPRSLRNGLSSKSHSKKKRDSLSDSDLDTSTALLGLSSGSDSEATSIQMDSHSYQVEVNDELSDLSSDSLSSLNSDELLGL